MKTKSIKNGIISSVATLMLLFILLVTSAQAVCFWIPGWFRHEYDKHNSVAYINGEMSLDDVVYVSDQVLYYCIGERNTISDVKVPIDGKEQLFFTEREIIHLEDCRNLIMGILHARTVSIIVFLLCVALLIKAKANKKTVVRSYFMTTAAVIIIAIVMVIFAITDFTAFFTKFHEIFFDNDYWILNPREDNLINIMREGMFRDSAALIAAIWAATTGIVSIAIKRH